MRFIRVAAEQHGEKILAVDEAENTLGRIEVFPGHDQRGVFFRLAAIEVREDQRDRGVGAALLKEAQRTMVRHRTHRLLFDVSPLLTPDAALFITRFGARYRWLEGSKTPDGRPWPECSCELDFKNPLDRPPDMREEDVAEISVLDWDGMRPVPRRDVSYRGLRSVPLPPMDPEILERTVESVPDMLETMTGVLHALHLHGYGFLWFDRTVYGGRPFHYYLMRCNMAL